jgi:hypothetical protein
MRTCFPYQIIHALRRSCYLLLIILLPATGAGQEGEPPIEIVDEPAEQFEQLDPGFRPKLFKPYQDELRQVPDTTVNRLQQDPAFSYANDEDYWKKRKQKAREEENTVFGGIVEALESAVGRVIIYTILVGIFVYILYRIVVVNQLFRLPGHSKKRGQAGAYDDMDELSGEGNIDDKIRKAAAEKDYRTAVRFMYLKGLRLLSDKGWLRLHAQATNHDYVHQVSKYPVGPAFRFLTDVYDYVWYGEFAVTETQFERLQSDFQRFYQSLKY